MGSFFQSHARTGATTADFLAHARWTTLLKPGVTQDALQAKYRPAPRG